MAHPGSTLTTLVLPWTWLFRFEHYMVRLTLIFSKVFINCKSITMKCFIPIKIHFTWWYLVFVNEICTCILVIMLKNDIMASFKNKQELIRFLCNHPHGTPNLSLSGEVKIPTRGGRCPDYYSYLLELLPEKSHIQVLADDTDIFVLLLHFCWELKPPIQISMKMFNGQVIDINASALKLGD